MTIMNAISVGMGLMGLLFVLFGGVALAAAVSEVVRNSKSRYWPIVVGTVVVSRLAEKERLGTGGERLLPWFYVDVTCEYFVLAKRFEIRQEDINDGRMYDTKSDAELALAKYPVGQQIPVYYNPNKPSESKVSPGFSVSPLIFGSLVGLPFFCVGVYLIFASVK